MTPNFVQIGAGRVALDHRPKMAAFASLKDSGCTHVLTLLSEREGARAVGAAATRAGLEWIWLPLANAEPPATDREADVRELFDRVGRLLDEGASFLVHCSAGIHRTGMIGYALLRHLGLSREDAIVELRRMRDLTADGVGEARLAWGDRFAGPAPSPPSP